MNLIRRYAIDRVFAATTSASSAKSSDIVDMQGYDGVVFLTSFNATATDNTLAVEGGTATASMSDLAGTGVDVTETAVRIEVTKPLKRYVRARVARKTATTISDIWCIRYGSMKQPEETTSTGRLAFSLTASPGSGTATST